MKSTRAFAAGLLALLPGISMFAQNTIDFIPVNKIQVQIQTGTSTWLPDPTNPYSFETNIGGSYTSDGSFPAGTNEIKSIPGSPLVHIGLTAPDSNNSEWRYKQNFGSQSALNSAFADGTYIITVGGNDITLNLNGGLYPDVPVATVSAGTWLGGGSNILQLTPGEASSGLTITSSAFGATNFSSGNSRIGIDVGGSDYNSPQTESFPTLNTDTLTLNISGGSLTAGNTYYASVEFNRIVDNVDLSATFGGTAQGVAVYSSSTNFQIQVIPEPSTYAAIAGAIALAGVMLHRRRRLA